MKNPFTDAYYTSSECSVGSELLTPTQTLNEDYIASSSVLMGEFIKMLPSSLAGHRSDQSASEDSSLTDSDRYVCAILLIVKWTFCQSEIDGFH